MKMRQRLSISTVMTIAVFAVITLAAALTSLGVLIYSSFVKVSLSRATTIPLFATTLAACAIIGTIISIPVNRLFIVPIRKLAEATRAVAKGDFSVRVEEARYSDELVALVKGFNSMATELGNTELFRTDFISNFSHEFKTPISSIRGFAKELLQDNTLSEAQKREYLTIIFEESQRLSNMASDVLLLTNLEHTQYVSNATGFSLDEQLRRSLLLLEQSWEKKELEPDVELESVDYYFDEELMAHLWINLLSNAIKFSPQGGRLGLRCKKTDTNVVVSISDEGQGISPTDINKIFDRFYKADASHKTDGNGLGLTLCLRITELCGGKIEVQSEIGKGTEFQVYLPLTAKCENKLKND